MSMPASSGTPHTRLGSGTSWLPDSSPVRAVTARWGQWLVSLHGAALAVGTCGAVNFVPRTLLATYGTRSPSGFAVYVQVRPGGENDR